MHCSNVHTILLQDNFCDTFPGLKILLLLEGLSKFWHSWVRLRSVTQPTEGVALQAQNQFPGQASVHLKTGFFFAQLFPNIFWLR